MKTNRLIIMGFLVTWVFSACSSEVPEGQRGPQPFAQQADVEKRQVQLKSLLASLDKGTSQQNKAALTPLYAWSVVHLGRAWPRVGPALERAMNQDRLTIDEPLVEFLGRVGPRALTLLAKGLIVPEAPTRKLTASLLVGSGSQGIKLLIASLPQVPGQDPVPRQVLLAQLEKQVAQKDPRARVGAITYLWLLADQKKVVDGSHSPAEKPIAMMCKLLDDPDSEVRISALERLSSLGLRARGAVPQVAALMSDPVPGVALVAASEIHRFGLAVLEPLSKLMEHEAAGIRQAAADALGRLGADQGGVSETVNELLIAASGEKDQEVRLHALRALFRQGPAEVVDQALILGLADPLERNRLEVAERMAEREANPRLVDALTKVVAGKDEKLALVALKSLAAYGPAAVSSFKVLRKQASSGLPAVRQDVGKTVVAVQPDVSLVADVLLVLLTDKIAAVRAEALVLCANHGAGFIRSGQAQKKVETLFDKIRTISLKDPDPRVRNTAVAALTNISKSLKPTGPEPDAADQPAPGGTAKSN